MTGEEVNPMTGELVEIFRWDPKEDRIHPEIVDAVIGC